MSGPDTRCFDCRVETLPVDERRAEFYMVTMDLWATHGAEDQYLCIGCLETRVGRTLTSTDFIACPVNNLETADVERCAYSWRTRRLIERLGDGRHRGSSMDSVS
jgi:hypothetical protein